MAYKRSGVRVSLAPPQKTHHIVFFSFSLYNLLVMRTTRVQAAQSPENRGVWDTLRKAIAPIAGAVAIAGAALFTIHTIEHATETNILPIQPEMLAQPNPDINPLIVDGALVMAGLGAVVASTRREK